MVLLGLQKLQDIDRFATMFLSYDLLAQRWVRYAYFYPFIECGAGIHDDRHSHNNLRPHHSRSGIDRCYKRV